MFNLDPKNEEILIRAANRFARALLASAAGTLLTIAAQTLPDVQMSDEMRQVTTLIIVPLLMALDKILRDKKFY